MQRLTNTPPKYRKHRASGQAVVTINGKDYYLGPHGTQTSKRQYDLLVGEYLTSGRVGPEQPEDGNAAIVELLAAYWKHCQKHYGRKASETADYATLIKRLKKFCGHTLVGEFGPLRLKAFRETLISTGLSRTTINHSVDRTRRIFKWGVANEIVEPDTLARLQSVAGLRFGKSEARETDPVKPVHDAFVSATMEHCSPPIAAMIDLQRATGMRSGEIVQMRTCDIDVSGEVWVYTPETHKTKYRGHTRLVYLGPKAQAILKQWLRPKLSEYLFQPIEAEQWRRNRQNENRKTPLSCGNRPGTNRKGKPRKSPGQKYTPQSYGQAVRKAVQRCNAALAAKGEQEIPHWHPHQLRHNHATMARREYGIETARVLLGHKSAAITETYAEADHTRAVEAAAKIG